MREQLAERIVRISRSPHFSMLAKQHRFKDQQCKIQRKGKNTIKFMPHNPDAGLQESSKYSFLLCRPKSLQALSTTGALSKHR